MADGSMVALPTELLTSPQVGSREIHLYALIQLHTHAYGDIYGRTPEDIAAQHGFPKRWGTEAWHDLCAAGWAGSAGPGLLLHVHSERNA